MLKERTVLHNNVLCAVTLSKIRALCRSRATETTVCIFEDSPKGHPNSCKRFVLPHPSVTGGKPLLSLLYYRSSATYDAKLSIGNGTYRAINTTNQYLLPSTVAAHGAKQGMPSNVTGGKSVWHHAIWNVSSAKRHTSVKAWKENKEKKCPTNTGDNNHRRLQATSEHRQKGNKKYSMQERNATAIKHVTQTNSNLCCSQHSKWSRSIACVKYCYSGQGMPRCLSNPVVGLEEQKNAKVFQASMFTACLRFVQEHRRSSRIRKYIYIYIPVVGRNDCS